MTSSQFKTSREITHLVVLPLAKLRESNPADLRYMRRAEEVWQSDDRHGQ